MYTCAFVTVFVNYSYILQVQVHSVVYIKHYRRSSYGISSLSGAVEFNLSAMPLPVKSASYCSIDQVSDGVSVVKTDDLFKRKHMVGWWPITEEGTRLLNVQGVHLHNIIDSLHAFVLSSI